MLNSQSRLPSKIQLPAELNSRRVAVAAQAVQGSSIESVYEVFDRLVGEKRLGGDVLDYGAGTGFGVKRLLGNPCFTSLAAIDILAKPAGVGSEVKWLQGDLNDRSPAADKTFDLIYSIEVVEHLENFRFQAREFFRMLRPGGTLILSTPNNESWRALSCLIQRGYYVCFGPLDYPMHLTPLLRIDMARGLAEAGFQSTEFFFNDRGAIPLFPRYTWQQLFFGQAGGIRFSDHILACARKAL